MSFLVLLTSVTRVTTLLSKFLDHGLTLTATGPPRFHSATRTCIHRLFALITADRHSSVSGLHDDAVVRAFLRSVSRSITVLFWYQLRLSLQSILLGSKLDSLLLGTYIRLVLSIHFIYHPRACDVSLPGLDQSSIAHALGT